MKLGDVVLAWSSEGEGDSKKLQWFIEKRGSNFVCASWKDAQGNLYHFDDFKFCEPYLFPPAAEFQSGEEVLVQQAGYGGDQWVKGVFVGFTPEKEAVVVRCNNVFIFDKVKTLNVTKRLKPLLTCFELLLDNGWEFRSAGEWIKTGELSIPPWMLIAYAPEETYPDFLIEEVYK